MSVISVKIFNENAASLASLDISVVNLNTLKNRIDAFIQSKKDANLCLHERNVGARRALFQKANSEFFFFPMMKANEFQKNQMSSGELYILFNEPFNYFSLCFLPENNTQKPRYKIKSVNFKNYSVMAAETHMYNMSNRLCSFLVYEKGSIVPCSDGSFLLKGLSINLLAKKNICQGLLLKKIEEPSASPEHPLGQISPTKNIEKFIEITCCSTEPFFSFFVKLPLLTDPALKQAVNEACIERAKSLNQEVSIIQDQVNLSYVFPDPDISSLILCLPNCMKMDFTSGRLSNGEILCSYSYSEENVNEGIFTFVILPSDFKKGIVQSDNYLRKDFPLWQYDEENCSKKCLSFQYLCLFKSSEFKLVSCSGNQYSFTNFSMKLLSTGRQAFLGLLCSRQKKEGPPSSFSSFRFSRKRHLSPSKSSLNLPCAPLVSDSQPSIPQTSMLNSQTWSMNLPYTQSVPPAPHPQLRTLQASPWMSANPSAGPPQGTIGIPYTQSSFPSLHPQPSSLLPSMWNFPADPSQGPIGMPSAQPTGFYGPFPSQTSASWWDPQTGPSQGPIGMSSAQPTSSYGVFPSQISWMAANSQIAAPWCTEGAMGVSASDGNKLEHFTLQDLPLDELQYILGEEKNDDYSQSESD